MHPSTPGGRFAAFLQNGLQRPLCAVWAPTWVLVSVFPASENVCTTPRCTGFRGEPVQCTSARFWSQPTHNLDLADLLAPRAELNAGWEVWPAEATSGFIDACRLQVSMCWTERERAATIALCRGADPSTGQPPEPPKDYSVLHGQPVAWKCLK